MDAKFDVSVLYAAIVLVPEISDTVVFHDAHALPEQAIWVAPFTRTFTDDKAALSYAVPETVVDDAVNVWPLAGEVIETVGADVSVGLLTVTLISSHPKLGELSAASAPNL